MALNAYLEHASDAEMAPSGSVSSMFSPAAYLVELYREAKKLHSSNSDHHLDKRRPDLASLVLSQENMDTLQSELGIFNNLLANLIFASGKLPDAENEFNVNPIHRMLATYRHTGSTPYHRPYTAVRECLLQKDPQLAVLTGSPVLAEKISVDSLLSLYENISPDLYALLTEEITEDNAEELLEKNFGVQNIALLNKISELAKYYNLDNTDLDFLNGLFQHSVYKAKGPVYTNGYFTTLRNTEEGLIYDTYSSTEGGNKDQFNYIEILPVGDDNYTVSLSMTKTTPGCNHLTIGVTDSKEKPINYPDYILEKDKHYTFTLKIPAEDFLNGASLYVKRRTASGAGYACGSIFYRETSSGSVYLLKLNKIIRLYKSLNLDGNDMLAMIKNNADLLTVDASVLRLMGLAYRYQQHYGLNIGQARVLAGGNIGQIMINGAPSEFSRLFSLTDSQGDTLAANGTVLELTPGEATDTFRIAALCRGLGVDSVGLHTLWSLTSSDSEFTCTLDNLSALYRVALLAQVNGLSVTGLQCLLNIAGLSSQPGSLKGEDLAGLVNTLQHLTSWLTDENLPVDALHLMLTDQYGTTLTPGAENLRATLQNNIADITLTGDELIAALAPLVAAEMQLSSTSMATAILQWFNQHPPSALISREDSSTALDIFWQKLLAGDDTLALVAGFQRLGQFSLLAQTLGLSDTELALFVNAPQKLRAGLATLEPVVETVCQLSRFHRWLQQCGKAATEVLTCLAEGTLTPALLADITGQDVTAMQQAAKAVMVKPKPGTDTDESVEQPFSGWDEIDATDQILSAAVYMGLTPGDLWKLLELNYINYPASVTFEDWVAASQVLMSALDDSQAQAVNAVLDEGYAEALGAWYIKNLAPAAVNTRDELNDWLLLDSRTAGSVMTTPVASAIASLQLYVNRVLNGAESEPNYDAQAQTFFTRWNQFNKSYSTWAGGKKLAYYPENYVDPTVRIGQTTMMSDMLQTLSQSALSEDTVASAFNTYMASFEKIANLSVICAYHDGEDLRQGLTWFIGQSQTDKGEFYWRTLDQSLLTDGKYPANAWSEWVKIDTAISPYNGLIKPVVFNSRLYLLWVEEHIESTPGEENSTGAYKLKWSWKLHDGSWATPQEKKKEKTIDDKTRLYCGYDNRYGFICYSLFEAGLTPSDVDKFPVYIIKSDNMVSTVSDVLLEKQKGNAEEKLSYNEDLLTMVYGQLDTTETNAVKVARYVSQNEDVEIRTVVEKGYGTEKLSYCSDGVLSKISTGDDGDGYKKITLDAKSIVTISPSKGNTSPLAKVINVAITNGLLKEDLLFRHENVDGTGFSGSHPSHIVGQSGDELFLIPVADDTCIISNVNLTSLADNPDDYEGMKLKDIMAKVVLKRDQAIFLGDHLSGDKYVSFYRDRDSFEDEDSVFNDDVLNVKISELTPQQINDVKKLLRSVECRNYSDVPLCNSVDLSVSAKKTYVRISYGNGFLRPSGGDYSCHLDLQNAKMIVSGDNIKFRVSKENFEKYILNKELMMEFELYFDSESYRLAGFQKFSIKIKEPYHQSPVILYHDEVSGVQYLDCPPYRIRLNTLFAHSLVDKSAAGLDAVLSMDTQTMQEPKMGRGTYATLTFGTYNKDIHGDSTAFSLHSGGGLSDDKFCPVFSGQLNPFTKTAVSLFLPVRLHDFGPTTMMLLRAQYASGETSTVLLYRSLEEIDTWVVEGELFEGLESISNLSATTEPMDFSGSNALYFWEMFYYVPMMVFQRMLDEQRYDDARTWLNYIWNPGGLIYNGKPAAWSWNVRPLEEDTSWNTVMPDTFDPDAVAQADPMHYKAATVMKLLEMLIARGDSLFRQVTPDALDEAKMWYDQAQTILGTRDLMLSSPVSWNNETLAAASGAESSLFLQEQNDQIDYYLQTLALRLYNLRHNLSIDGQPLSLPIYSSPSDPKILQAATVAAASGGSDLPVVDFIPQYRFPVMLQDARNMVGQLSQFGSTLLNVAERQDAEAMAELLQTQGSELAQQTIAVQQKTVDEIDADMLALKATQDGTKARLNSYQSLYDENINSNEQRVMDLNAEASSIAYRASAFTTAGAVLDMAPNIFGLADGGCRWGAVLSALGMTTQLDADLKRMESDKIAQSESYNRRRQEWAIQRDIAQHELEQITAQLNSLSVRREGAVLQKAYLETQQQHTLAQMSFLKSKFSNQSLYSWMKGKLSTIYYSFYDLTVSRCLMAEKAYRYDTGTEDTAFIRAGAWQGTYAGLLSGETLSLSLAQMEAAYLKQDTRALEVTKTVSLAQYYSGMGDDAFTFREEVGKIISAGSGSAGDGTNGLTVQDGALQVAVKLSDLNIQNDYPAGLGDLRRVRQVSVTLPALLGPYEDVRAVLNYGGSVIMPKGCTAIAISHGMHDSGQFQLNFEDSRYLPFEGIPVDDSGTLTLLFPDMAKGQKDLLNSLNDVILHIAYTIR